ncbi:hypothetical protein [Streptomyces paromomycinus]|uniref:Uncharacterized protein n=1 Tax=Streptomyces paromomycinus TaxID=92743 RepID=A0A401W2L4_STREY|nr:hypothetical protein [Streptomyces paromomycinus]GCD43583.1 hypothetical protein GKJPGBOP_03264 [Streptomyces paromomycinus]
MKALLWLLLAACLLGNLFVNMTVGEGAKQILLSVACGVGALAAAAGLWLSRERRA